MAQFPIVDVAGVGLNATDTIIRLPHFPSSDSKVEILSSEVLPGGQVASAMVACQTWGLRTRYVGKLGDDAATRMHREELARSGVESHLLEAIGSSSQIAYILVDERTGERTVLWKRDARLELRREELQREWVTCSRLLLVDGHDTAAAAQAARWARETRIPVVADLDNLYPGVQGLLEYTDYMISSHEFLARLLNVKNPVESLPMISRQFGCRVAGVTLGIGGVLAWDGTRFHYSSAFRVETVDTTGAGDIFHAGFVYGLAQRWELDHILEFSCAVAALNCTTSGARGGIRTIGEIENFMQCADKYAPEYDVARL
jgi:sulfofructose kinase